MKDDLDFTPPYCFNCVRRNVTKAECEDCIAAREETIRDNSTGKERSAI